MKKFINIAIFCAFVVSAVGCQKDMSKNDKKKSRRSGHSQVESVQKSTK